MKVIFLDIDGVLCFARKHMHYLEKSKLRHLACIQKRTQAEIVLISVWRKFDTHRDNLLADFKKYNIGWNPENRTGQLYYPGMNERPSEIRDYLTAHPEIENFAIIDDENHKSFGHHMFHASCHFKTPGQLYLEGLIGSAGLTRELADRVIAYLNKKKSDYLL